MGFFLTLFYKMLDSLKNTFLTRFTKMTYATDADLYAVPYLEFRRANNGDRHRLLLCDMPLEIEYQDNEYCVVANGWIVSEHMPGRYDVLNDRPCRDYRIWPEDYLVFHYKDYVLVRDSDISLIEFVDKAEPVRRMAYTEQAIDLL